MICLSKYIEENSNLFHIALKEIDKIKEKEEWGKELDDMLCHRINKVINEKGHVLWAMINEEFVRVQLFNNTVRKEIVEIDKLRGFVIKKKHEILNFDWPDDIVFNKWKE